VRLVQHYEAPRKCHHRVCIQVVFGFWLLTGTLASHTNKFSRDLRFSRNVNLEIFRLCKSQNSRDFCSQSRVFLPSVVDKISSFFFSRFCAWTSLDRTQGSTDLLPLCTAIEHREGSSWAEVQLEPHALIKWQLRLELSWSSAWASFETNNNRRLKLNFSSSLIWN